MKTILPAAHDRNGDRCALTPPVFEDLMTTANDPEFTLFVRRRQRLNERLDSTKQQIDAWISEHEADAPSMTALATLEGLLKTRRDVLADLVALDDEFMGHLIDLRARASKD
jgi:hypothetical protein